MFIFITLLDGHVISHIDNPGNVGNEFVLLLIIIETTKHYY
jgi:hypothetical protein